MEGLHRSVTHADIVGMNDDSAIVFRKAQFLEK
jgi:hypothetical protein